MSTVGIIANPAAGKDIRRLVSAASPVSDMAKIGIIRRAAIGAVEGGARRLVLADDRHALARRALKGIDGIDGIVPGVEVEIAVLDLPLFSSSRDSQRAAAAMAETGVGAVIVLGGDGTHRDVAKGWRRAPMVALSTGTNNVFPRSVEATMAGHAAGLVAARSVSLDDVADDAAVIDVEVESVDGESREDLGLVDVALTAGAFVGSRAVWEVGALRELVTAIAEPSSVGLSAIAAAVAPTDRRARTGVHVSFPDEARPATACVRCAIAPGSYADIAIAGHRRLGPDDEVVLTGPGVLSFDGERDLVMAPGEQARIRVSDGGPRVIDVARTMLAYRNSRPDNRGED
ncbi:MAG: diacylglycerol kinase family protein [Acidimicrobiales bacterium]